MKKIFTSISMALCLAASSFNASAQQATQLSDAQKQEIQQAESSAGSFRANQGTSRHRHLGLGTTEIDGGLFG